MRKDREIAICDVLVSLLSAFLVGQIFRVVYSERQEALQKIIFLRVKSLFLYRSIIPLKTHTQDLDYLR
jgi:hypothetical protein